MGHPASRSRHRLSRAEFSRWLRSVPPDDLHHYELLDGFIVTEPPAGWPHGEIAPRLLARIYDFVQSRRLGRVFDSSQGFDLPGDNTVEPDIAFVSHERWREIERPIRGFPAVVPDLVVEILSPSTRRIDQTRKQRIYERSGVRELWLVDPTARSVTRFVGSDRGFDTGRSFDATDTMRSVLLEGLEIVVGGLFPEE